MSDLPPSSALTAEGERKASKHPQSHMNKSIFFPRMWRKKHLFSSSVVLFCLSETTLQSKVHLFFPFSQFCFSLRRNTSSGQHPTQMPGCVHWALQEYRKVCALFVRALSTCASSFKALKDLKTAQYLL